MADIGDITWENGRTSGGWPIVGDRVVIEGQPHVVTAIEHGETALPYWGGYTVTAEPERENVRPEGGSNG